MQLQEENRQRLVAMPISAQLQLLHTLKDRLRSIASDQQYILQQQEPLAQGQFGFPNWPVLLGLIT